MERQASSHLAEQSCHVHLVSLTVGQLSTSGTGEMSGLSGPQNKEAENTVRAGETPPRSSRRTLCPARVNGGHRAEI